jgi:hypothetical protein
MTTCLDCGGDGASRLELAAHCDPLPPVTVLGEWCPACAESVQRMRGRVLTHWLLHLFASRYEEHRRETRAAADWWEELVRRWKRRTDDDWPD